MRQLLGKKPRAYGVDINSNERRYIRSGYPGSRVDTEFGGKVDFCGDRRTGEPGEKPLETD